MKIGYVWQNTSIASLIFNVNELQPFVQEWGLCASITHNNGKNINAYQSRNSPP